MQDLVLCGIPKGMVQDGGPSGPGKSSPLSHSARVSDKTIEDLMATNYKIQITTLEKLCTWSQ
ncbi:hypothetical protein BTUL_0067g00470 [Botrytis tulipae]|uniref:Uncharacterized protein n=1 Tax=Botrytis tulipae TaxID=87230 RepID=A0A4Z1EML4_9HELO|nr:hypothetical protein BTUL_0067g00470 [Botrytis tulipae]